MVKSKTFGLCSEHFIASGMDKTRRFLGDAGLDRMRMKSSAMLAFAIKYGAPYAFMYRMMELLGLPHNRLPFRSLAERVMKYSPEMLDSNFEILLWGESSLLPDPASAILDDDELFETKRLWDEFWKLRKNAGSRIEFSRCKSFVSYERRIGSIGAFFQKYSFRNIEKVLSDAFEKGQTPDESLENIVQLFTDVGHPFWESRKSFLPDRKTETASTLFSREKALELIVDAVCPFMRVSAELNKEGHEKLAAIEKMYLAVPKLGSNSILSTMKNKCFPKMHRIFDSAAQQQGAIHIHHNFCKINSDDCKQCLMRYAVTHTSYKGVPKVNDVEN